MKHVFLLNAHSLSDGKGQALCSRIKEKCRGLSYEIYMSSSIEDARAKAIAEAETDEEVCLYAVGGDGTIHQIADAIYPFSNVILSAIPAGTGNDFIRNFGTKKDFLSLSHITDGVVHEVDLLQLSPFTCLNMVNIGFDESVVERVDRLRRLPAFLHPFSYILGVIIQLFRYPKEELRIEFDNGEIYEGKCLLTFVANGKYCGGGFKAASPAEYDDGKMDVMIVRPISRLAFLSMVGQYKKGTLIGTDKCDKIALYRQTHTLKISKKTPFRICLDGEIHECKSLDFSVLSRRIRFKAPCHT